MAAFLCVLFVVSLLFAQALAFVVPFRSSLPARSPLRQSLDEQAWTAELTAHIRKRKDLRDARIKPTPVDAAVPTQTQTQTQQSPAGKRILLQGKERIPDRPNPNNLRVLGGSKRGMRIDSPQVYLRPMMAKVRAALFSTLSFMGVFDAGDVRVLDVFAGSGSVGLEALSRGAAHTTFVDLSRDCVNTALRNADRLGFKSQCAAVCASAQSVLVDPHRHGLSQPFQLLSLTPPYQEVSYSDLLSQLSSSPLLQENSILVLEYPVEMGSLPFSLFNEQLLGLRNRRHGRTILAMYVNRPSKQFDLRPDEFTNEFVKKGRS